MDLQELYHSGATISSNDGPYTDLLDEIPKELDIEKFERGRQFYKKNVFACNKGMFYSLVIGLSLDRFLDDLVSTGETSKPLDAFRRYFNTNLHVIKWHYGNIWSRHSSARKSILFVRHRHFKAREFLSKADYKGFEKPSKDLVEAQKLFKRNPKSFDDKGSTYSKKKGEPNIHISQFDMSLVQTGFIGLIILYPKRLGIRCTEKELDDFVYVWRWIGYLLGIEDCNNICLGGYRQAYSICKEVETELIIPSLANPSEKFEPMANAFLEGIRLVTKNVFVYKLRVIIALAFECSGTPIPFKVSFWDRVRMLCDYVLTNAMLYIPGLTLLFNYLFEKALGCSKMT